jgi:hypothetical protein
MLWAGLPTAALSTSHIAVQTLANMWPWLDLNQIIGLPPEQTTLHGNRVELCDLCGVARTIIGDAKMPFRARSIN